MEERRQINRVQYIAKSVIVVCDTEETIYVEVENVSPLGMGIRMKADAPDILGKDIIIVAETLIMYAEVNRQEKQEDGTYVVGIQAKKFTQDVLEYLFSHIGSHNIEQSHKKVTKTFKKDILCDRRVTLTCYDKFR